ncbi:predicted protein [Sclerotinia sclerotiorum 1980 UF-70]|uniref:Uncharacterized protein n=1 Tax=Sclerotinia sclerotiorum (strain ATCC 18683 / 1980 / Ss-1) TaxID=665079 RepID=A7E672_SCLS1|nr:predicted protein [Sclerotinia sclerotiorum 1980 UF-70]EDN91394.1 predicted protein [Sclerotinia sclerotiorum 1980 UF-70]
MDIGDVPMIEFGNTESQDQVQQDLTFDAQNQCGNEGRDSRW